MPALENRTRRFDPDRKTKIVEAALGIARNQGLKSVTMRNVASAADVPLGSMSYHFADKAELVESVVDAARESTLRKTTGDFRENVREMGLAEAVAEMVLTLTGSNRDQLVFEMDMFLLAMHDESFKTQSARWSADLTNLLAQFTTQERAKALAMLIDGLCLNSAVIGTEYSREEIVGITKLLAE